MIVRSLSLTRRMIRETERHAGSMARLVFYDGVMPSSTDGVADGQKVHVQDMPADFVANMTYAQEPHMPDGATYWRLLDNGGNVVAQGDAK